MSSSDELDETSIFLDVDPEVIAPYISDADTICSICYAEFLDPDDLRIHINQVHKEQRKSLWKCQFCSEECSDVMKYAEHIRDIHLPSLICCSSCWRVFDNDEDYNEHNKKHYFNKSIRTYCCSQCTQRYNDLFALKKHEFECHDNVRKSGGVMLHSIFPYLSAALKVKCTTFLKSLNSDIVYKCTSCSFSSVDIKTYIKHIKPKKCKVYVCFTCCSVFKKRRNIDKHMRSNCSLFGDKDTKLCPDCNINIVKKVYSNHKIHCKPIKCYICDIVFKTMNDWSEHQSKMHTSTSVSVETCKFCWKRFVGSVAMNKHVDKIHKPELHLYKYLCVYCKSVFKHPQKLFAHFVTQHKDLNPYTCKICDKEFKLRKKFTIHIKLSHKSEGFVEFDENYHVFFTDKKSDNPFIPKSLYIDEPQTDDYNSIGNQFESDFMDTVETDGNQTEVDVQPRLKRKRMPNRKTNNETVSIESSDDNEPLQSVRKRVKLMKKFIPVNEIKKKQTNKNLLTCKVCRKYCYTQQNFQHHISLHSKHEAKKCIKCAKIFKSKSKLNEHIANEHSSSKLTETLKILLEKRKTGGSLADDLPMQEKFRRTIRKVTALTTSRATITPVSEKLSVQKFLENFVPEDNKTGVEIDNTVTISLVSGIDKEPIIKMNKFKATPISKALKLAMPVKFVDRYPEKVNISIRLVTPRLQENDYSDHSNDSPDMDRYESIPDVAEEVMLENSDHEQNGNKIDSSHKLIIPKLKMEFEDVKIAHLLPEAPYYKIVKVKDVLDVPKEDKVDNETPESPIKLPDGTKLVTANPLAHLLGENTDKIMSSFKSNYYKTKKKNFQGMLAKALTMLDKPSNTPRKKRKTVADNETEK